MRDLTDPTHGPHAVQLVVDAILSDWSIPVVLHRGDPVVSVRDHYDLQGTRPNAHRRGGQRDPRPRLHGRAPWRR